MMIYTGIILLELVLVEMNFVGLFRVIQGNKKQAGADLCQAQYKLGLVKFWFDSVASLKFDCMVPGQMLHGQLLHGQMLHGQMLHGQMLHGQMLHGQMLHGQMVLGHLSTVQDGSTNLKCPPRYFPWGEGEVEINTNSVQLCWSWD